MAEKGILPELSTKSLYNDFNHLIHFEPLKTLCQKVNFDLKHLILYLDLTLEPQILLRFGNNSLISYTRKNLGQKS